MAYHIFKVQVKLSEGVSEYFLHHESYTPTGRRLYVFRNHLIERYGILKTTPFKITWNDDDGDIINIFNEVDWCIFMERKGTKVIIEVQKNVITIEAAKDAISPDVNSYIKTTLQRPIQHLEVQCLHLKEENRLLKEQRDKLHFFKDRRKVLKKTKTTVPVLKKTETTVPVLKKTETTVPVLKKTETTVPIRKSVPFVVDEIESDADCPFLVSVEASNDFNSHTKTDKPNMESQEQKGQSTIPQANEMFGKSVSFTEDLNESDADCPSLLSVKDSVDFNSHIKTDQPNMVSQEQKDPSRVRQLIETYLKSVSFAEDVIESDADCPSLISVKDSVDFNSHIKTDQPNMVSQEQKDPSRVRQLIETYLKSVSFAEDVIESDADCPSLISVKDSVDFNSHIKTDQPNMVSQEQKDPSRVRQLIETYLKSVSFAEDVIESDADCPSLISVKDSVDFNSHIKTDQPNMKSQEQKNQSTVRQVDEMYEKSESFAVDVIESDSDWPSLLPVTGWVDFNSHISSSAVSIDLNDQVLAPHYDTTTNITTSNSENNCSSHANLLISAAISKMKSMGYTNDGGWLTQLMEHVDGNIQEALEILKEGESKCLRIF